ncbi:MAG TPA: hypothetical protein PK843_15255 [bacterium]|nr:hypothetical protein [bacterium]
MREKTRNVFFVFLGVMGLLLNRQYSGLYQDMAACYAGNICASFALYFVLSNLSFQIKGGRLWTAGMALAVVELFEVTNGFGIMTNTFDQTDLFANAVGVALALLIDTAASEASRRRSNDG